MSGGIAKNGRRFFRTVLVFSLAGPILGGMISNLIAFVAFFVPGLILVHGVNGAFSVLRAAYVILAVGLLYSVIFAIAPAIIAGFAVAAWEYSHGRSALWFAAIAGVLGGVASVPVYWLFMRWSPTLASSFDTGEALAIIAGAVIATISCWWLLRPKVQEA